MSETIRLSGPGIEVHIDPATPSIRLICPATRGEWSLDLSTVLADSSGQAMPLYGAPGVRHEPAWASHDTSRASALALKHSERRGTTAAELTWRGPAGTLVTLWEMRPDGLEVTALAGPSTVTSCALPGAFRPSLGRATAVVPMCQGVHHRGTGAPFGFNIIRNGHAGWSMPFTALIGEREALLQVAADEHDARLWFERTDGGPLTAVWLQDPSRGAMRYSRTVRLSFTGPSPAAAALAYRETVRRSGRLVTWEAKLSERPMLDRLFGAVMCFIGYCRDDQVDYAAGFRRLKAMGVDRAFVYPISFGSIREDFKMGGRDPIDIREHLPLLDELGYLAASWMWIEDGPGDRPENLQLNARGEPHMSWQIDDVKWYKTCAARAVALSNGIQDKRMAGLTAQHFDVTASRVASECYHPDHPLDRREDALWRRKTLESAARRGLAVSSEGFWGYATPSYDIGSVKIPRAIHADWHTIPLTSLVYHDSCIHDWWEVDNYNNPHHQSQFGRDRHYFPMGGGVQEHQSLQDALAGWPPNVMPFGVQYQFVNGVGPATELYAYHLDMPEVRRALDLALPVARLHSRVGRIACVDHRILAADGTVQTTTFADGTRVFVNFGDQAVDVPEAGPLAPLTWKTRD